MPLIGAVVGAILLGFSSAIWYLLLASTLNNILYGTESPGSVLIGYGLLFCLYPVVVCSGAFAGARLVTILITRRDNLLSRGITLFYLFSIVAVIYTAIIGGLLVLMIYAELIFCDRLIRDYPSSLGGVLLITNMLFSSFIGGRVSAIWGVRLAALSSKLYR